MIDKYIKITEDKVELNSNFASQSKKIEKVYT